MNVDKINKAVKVAHEFLNRVDALAKPDAKNIVGGYVSGQPILRAPVGKESGALRRQSMELSRALSEMRKP